MLQARSDRTTTRGCYPHTTPRSAIAHGRSRWPKQRLLCAYFHLCTSKRKQTEYFFVLVKQVNWYFGGAGEGIQFVGRWRQQVFTHLTSILRGFTKDKSTQFTCFTSTNVLNLLAWLQRGAPRGEQKKGRATSQNDDAAARVRPLVLNVLNLLD